MLDHAQYEPRREKTGFLHNAKTKTQIIFVVTAKLISAFVFATLIVQSLYFLNTKFQASSHLLWLYSLVCVGTGRKPRRPVFSQRGSYHLAHVHQIHLHIPLNQVLYFFYRSVLMFYPCSTLFNCPWVNRNQNQGDVSGSLPLFFHSICNC